MMDPVWRDAVTRILASSRRKRVAVETLEAAVRRLPRGLQTDFEVHIRLLETLTAMAAEGCLRLPKGRHLWDHRTGLPRYVTALRPEADAKKAARRRSLADLRNATAWEPTRMVGFAHTLRSQAELDRAVKVNRYLLERPPEPERVPHRERALEIFGAEKALDPFVQGGLFGGRISFEDLDCFYCPEPLPFRPFSPDPEETRAKPLLVVENANTYWSCGKANALAGRYAAIVYGQGFMACAAERASDGLGEIEEQVQAAGIRYFGDLDPSGIAIPLRINRYRQRRRMASLTPDERLYGALLKKNLAVVYTRSQAKDHDPEGARHWLGDELAAIYLARVDRMRWPQEGLTAADILAAWDCRDMIISKGDRL